MMKAAKNASKSKGSVGQNTPARRASHRPAHPGTKKRSAGARRPDAARVQAALYRIADAASAASDLPRFYEEIHHIVGELMYARNFYLILVDQERQLLYTAYWVDEVDDPPGQAIPISEAIAARYLISLVLESGQMLHLDREEIEDMTRREVLRPYGTVSEDWIGAPLVSEGRIEGVLVVQSYKKGIRYSAQDAELLTFVAQHIAVALTRARAIEQTRQQAAELAVINSVQEGLASKLDLQAIVDLVGDKIRSIFSADIVFIALFDPQTGLMHFPYAVGNDERAYPSPRSPTGFSGEVLRTGKPILINDHFEEQQARMGSVTLADRPARVLSAIYVPIRANDRTTGVISLQTEEREGAFTPSSARLLETIASSLGVALENARLFDETQMRNREITEALEQQTATREILQVIASSPNDIKPVLDAVAENAARLCDANDVQIYQVDGDWLRQVTHFGPLPALHDGEALPLVKGLVTGRAVIERRTIHIEDGAKLSAAEYPDSVALQKRLGHRTALSTPMLREGAAIGAIVVRRNEVRPFTEKQVGLLATFASQAAIAIENVRLFNQTKRLLTETQQRAAELQIINSIQQGLAAELDLQAIVDLVGDKIRDIFDAQSVAIGTYDHANGLVDYSYVVQKGRRVKMGPQPFAGMSRYMIDHRRTLLLNENAARRLEEIGAVFPGDFNLPRSTLYVPLLSGDTVKGVVNIANLDRENAFSESDVRLLETLAASMSVALENARLFTETQRLLQETEQRAAELATVNRVSQALVSQVDLAALIQLAGDQIRDSFHADVTYIALLDHADNLIRFPYIDGESLTTIKLGEGLTSKIIETGRPLLINRDVESVRTEMGVTRIGLAAEAYLGVPIVVGRETIGVISVQYTHEEGRFDENDQRLLATIAANVGVAIEKARLYHQTEMQKQYFEQIVQSSPVAIALLDFDARVVTWNPTAEKLFGYTPEEAIGQNIDDLVANVDGIREEARHLTATGLQNEYARVLTRRTRKDGSLVDVEVVAASVRAGGRVLGYLAIYHDITELESARRRAEDANRAKSTFLANMSHELRTPLNAIIGFTRIVRRKSEGVLPDKQIENLDKVLISAEHLLSLINTVLDIAKIEAGRMGVSAARFDPAGLIEVCATTALPLLKPGVALKKEFPPDLPPGYSDQDKIKQILLNLLSNAAKFTHAGQIVIRASVQDDQLAIAVADSGIGIPEEALGRIFDEFQQADSTTTRLYGGTGLGLSISRDLARLLGGDLVAASTPGVGSAFTLTVPLHYGDKPSPPSAPVPEGAQTEGRTGASEPPVVLAIDDDPDAILLLSEQLNEAGYRVVGVRSGDEALQKARALHPYAITLDVLMPDKDGWQVLRELKSDAALRDIPVLMLSIVDGRTLGRQLGARDYLLKPVDGDELLTALRRLEPAAR